MFPLIGLVVLLAMVFGGFAITGGALGPVMHALPPIHVFDVEKARETSCHQIT